MKRTVVNISASAVLLIALFVLFFQGFAFPSISRAVGIVLRLLVGAAVQLLFFANFRRLWLRLLPVVAVFALAIWGGWLYFTSPSWINAELVDWLGDYCSFFFGCLPMWASCFADGYNK